MICTECENKITDGSIFCNMCGAKIPNNKAINIKIKINNRQRKRIKLHKNILQKELNQIITYFSKNAPQNNIVTAIGTRSFIRL